MSERETTRFEWPSGWLAAAIYLGLAIAYFLPAFLPGQQVYGSDFLAGGFPFHEFISRRFADGTLPKWVPYVYGGLPLFANPGSTYHPFRFLADLLFDPSRIFPAIYVMQFTLAGVGAYWLSRELGIRRWVAFVAGLGFQFTGLIMSFVLAGHEGRMIVATLTPLVLFFLHRGVRTGRLVWFAGASLTLGSALLSFQIQSSYYLLLLGAAWGVFAIVRTGVRGWRSVAGRVALGLGAVAVAFAIASVNFLPFLDYVEQSPRGEGGRGYEYATSWSMPPAEISGLILPEQAGLNEQYTGSNPFKLHTEYVGLVVFLLGLLGAYHCRRDRYWWFFIAAAAVALTFSFGGHTPIYRIYYEILPGTRRFRAPSISFFVVSAALVMAAALALERLAALRDTLQADPDDEGARRDRARTGYILAVASALALIVVLVSTGPTTEHGRQLAAGALRLALVTWLTAGAVWFWLRGSFPTPALMAVLAVLTVADLWIVDRRFFETVDGPGMLYGKDDVVSFLEARPERSRVWVLPGQLQGGRAYGGGLRNYLMHFGLDQVAGEHGNQLQRYNEYLGAGERTYVDWHNVMDDLRLLLGADTARIRRDDPHFLQAANIRYIVSLAELPLPLAYQGRSGLVYEVPSALPRTYLVGEARVVADRDEALATIAGPGFDPSSVALVDRALEAPLPGGPVDGETRIEEYDPDRVVVRALVDRDALLILADNYYQDWRVTVDGTPAQLVRANHAFRGVRLAAGEHEVVFEFHPADVYAGLAISVTAMLLALGVVGWTQIQSRGKTEPRARAAA
mgnify:CR=1 FL=1